jgi:hypothetical protein
VKYVSINDRLSEFLKVVLNDNTAETIDWGSLWLQGERHLYCLVKGGQFEARFNRNSQYELARLLEFDEQAQQYYCVTNGVRHYLAMKEG